MFGRRKFYLIGIKLSVQRELESFGLRDYLVELEEKFGIMHLVIETV